MRNSLSQRMRRDAAALRRRLTKASRWGREERLRRERNRALKEHNLLLQTLTHIELKDLRVHLYQHTVEFLLRCKDPGGKERAVLDQIERIKPAHRDREKENQPVTKGTTQITMDGNTEGDTAENCSAHNTNQVDMSDQEQHTLESVSKLSTERHEQQLTENEEGEPPKTGMKESHPTRSSRNMPHRRHKRHLFSRRKKRALLKADGLSELNVDTSCDVPDISDSLPNGKSSDSPLLNEIHLVGNESPCSEGYDFAPRPSDNSKDLEHNSSPANQPPAVNQGDSLSQSLNCCLSLKAGLKYYPTVYLVRMTNPTGKEGAGQESEAERQREKQGESVAVVSHNTKRTVGNDVNTAEGKKAVRELYFSPITVGGVDQALKVMFNITNSADTDVKTIASPQVKEQIKAADKTPQSEISTASEDDFTHMMPADKFITNKGLNNLENENSSKTADSSIKFSEIDTQINSNIINAGDKTDVESIVRKMFAKRNLATEKSSDAAPVVENKEDEVAVTSSDLKAGEVAAVRNSKQTVETADTQVAVSETENNDKKGKVRVKNSKRCVKKAGDKMDTAKADLTEMVKNVTAVENIDQRITHTIIDVESSPKMTDGLAHNNVKLKSEKRSNVNKARGTAETENEVVQDQKSLEAKEKVGRRPGRLRNRAEEAVEKTETEKGEINSENADVNTVAVEGADMVKHIETSPNEARESTADDDMKVDGGLASTGNRMEEERKCVSAVIDKTLKIAPEKASETESTKKTVSEVGVKARDIQNKMDNERQQNLDTQMNDPEQNSINIPRSNGSNVIIIKDIRVTLSDAFKSMKDELKRSVQEPKKMSGKSKSITTHLSKHLQHDRMIKEHIKKLIELDKEKSKRGKKGQESESSEVDCGNVVTPVFMTSSSDQNTSPKHQNETSTAKPGSSELLSLCPAPVGSTKDHPPLAQIQTNIPLKKRMFRESTETESDVNITTPVSAMETQLKENEDGMEIQRSVSWSGSKPSCDIPESPTAQIQQKVFKKTCVKQDKRCYFPSDNEQYECENQHITEVKDMMVEDATVVNVEKEPSDKQTQLENESGYKSTDPVALEVRNEQEKPKDTHSESAACGQSEHSLEQIIGANQFRQTTTEETTVSLQDEFSVQENLLKKEVCVKEEHENNLRIRLKRKRGEEWEMERSELEDVTEMETKMPDTCDSFMADPFKAILDSVSVLNVEMSKGVWGPHEAERCFELEQTAKAGQAAWEVCTKNVHSKLKKKKEISAVMKSNAQPKGDLMGYSNEMLKDEKFFLDKVEQWPQSAVVKIESDDGSAQPLAPIRLCRKTEGWWIVDGMEKHLGKSRKMRKPLRGSKSRWETKRSPDSSESLTNEVPLHKIKEEFQSPCRQFKESCCNISRKGTALRSESAPFSLSLSPLSLNSPCYEDAAEVVSLNNYQNVKELFTEKRMAEVMNKKNAKKDFGMRNELDTTKNSCLSHNLLQINKSLSKLQALSQMDKSASVDNSETVSSQGQQKPQSPLLIFPDKSPCSDFGFGNADDLIECLNLEGYYPDNSQNNLPSAFSDFCQGEPPNTGSFSSPFSQSPSDVWNPETPYLGSPSPCGSFSPPNDFGFPDLNLTKNEALLSGPDLSSKQKMGNADFGISLKDAEAAQFPFDFTMTKTSTSKEVPKLAHLMQSAKTEWNHKDSFMCSATSSEGHSQSLPASSQAQGVESIIPGCSFNSRTEFAKVPPFSLEKTQGPVHSLTANRNQSVGSSQTSVAGMYNSGALNQPLKPFHSPLLSGKSSIYPHKVISSADTFHRTYDKKASLFQSSNPIKLESSKQSHFCKGNTATERADFASKFQSTKHSSPNLFSNQLSFSLPSSLTGSHQGGDYSHTLGKGSKTFEANNCPNTSSTQGDRVHPFYYVTSSKTSSVLQNVTSNKAQDLGSGCLTKDISSQKPFSSNQSPLCHSLPLGKNMSMAKPHAMVAPTQNPHLTCSESLASASKHQPGYSHCDPVEFAFNSAFSTDVSQQSSAHITQRDIPEQERQANKTQSAYLACSTQSHPPYVVNFTGDHSVTLGYSEDGEGLNYSGVPTPNYTYHCLMDPSGTQGRLVLEPCGLSSNSYSSSPSVGGFSGSKGQEEQNGRKDAHQQEQSGNRPFVSHHFSTSTHSTSLSDRKPKRLRLVVTDGTVDLDLHYTD